MKTMTHLPGRRASAMPASEPRMVAMIGRADRGLQRGGDRAPDHGVVWQGLVPVEPEPVPGQQRSALVERVGHDDEDRQEQEARRRARPRSGAARSSSLDAACGRRRRFESPAARATVTSALTRAPPASDTRRFRCTSARIAKTDQREHAHGEQDHGDQHHRHRRPERPVLRHQELARPPCWPTMLPFAPPSTAAVM